MKASEAGKLNDNVIVFGGIVRDGHRIGRHPEMQSVTRDFSAVLTMHRAIDRDLILMIKLESK